MPGWPGTTSAGLYTMMRKPVGRVSISSSTLEFCDAQQDLTVMRMVFKFLISLLITLQEPAPIFGQQFWAMAARRWNLVRPRDITRHLKASHALMHASMYAIVHDRGCGNNTLPWCAGCGCCVPAYSARVGQAGVVKLVGDLRHFRMRPPSCEGML